MTTLADDEILAHKRIALLELIQKHIWQRDLLELVEPLARLLLTGRATDEQREALLNYMLQTGDTADPQAFTERLVQHLPNYKEDIMTIAERLEQKGLETGLKRGRVEGLETGLERGRMEGEMMVLARQLARRFGPLPDWAWDRLRQADATQLENWADAVLDAASLTGVLGAPPSLH
ncbi:MAG: Rpn family recombination-promoting nuclease/putative transposase [Azoarcus sp.]|jgi:predicted transposase/invertase (TIGR01784 family)|nr:Rpn family recombination-promoting nuclease/putative transposase [Azoarcus sp.]